MTTQQIECFLEAARVLNFSKAAANLYMTQPTLSRNIVSLEREMGFKLFDRSSFQGTHLTLAGERMRLAFLKLNEDLENARQEAMSHTAKADLTLFFGLLEGQIIDPVLYAFLRDFKKAFPNITIETIYAGYHPLMNDLVNGNLDAAVTLDMEIASRENLEVVHFYNLDTLLVVPRALAPEGDPDSPRSIAEFAGMPFVCTDKNDSPMIISKLYETCARVGFVPKLCFVRGLREQTAFMEAGKGIAGMNEHHVIWHNPDIVGVRIKEFDPQPFSLCYARDSANPAVQALHSFVQTQKQQA